MAVTFWCWNTRRINFLPRGRNPIGLNVSCNLFTAGELNNLRATFNSMLIQLAVNPVIVVSTPRPMHYAALLVRGPSSLFMRCFGKRGPSGGASSKRKLKWTNFFPSIADLTYLIENLFPRGMKRSRWGSSGVCLRIFCTHRVLMCKRRRLFIFLCRQSELLNIYMAS